MTIQHILALAVGHSGQYFKGYWYPEEVLENLFPHTAAHKTKRYVATQIINDQRKLPARYTDPYRVKGGLEQIEKDVRNFVGHYCSVAMVRDIHIRIHMDVVASSWSPAQITALDKYYIADNPSRDQVAIYIAHVMHAIICS